MTVSTPSSTSGKRALLPTGVIFTVAAILGLFYAYVVWNAVTLLVYQASGVLGINGLGWFVLLLAVVFPIAVFAAAFAIGWRRNLLQFSLVMVAGLALVAVFWLNILAYDYSYGGSLLG